jgi:hypothetical protein
MVEIAPCSSSCLKKAVAYQIWFALPERPVSDAPFVSAEIFYDGSEQNCHEEHSSV